MHTPIIIALPAGFTIPTNAGLHDDMQFFEMKEHMFTICAPHYDGDTVSYFYHAWDSDEGQVTISYQTHDGEDAHEAVNMSEWDGGWDVSVTTGSDTWGLAETATAVADAIALHDALGRDLKA
jgi:hypothetical protein